MNLQTICCLLTLSFLLSSCNPERVHYTNELKEEMADSKNQADYQRWFNWNGQWSSGKVSAVVQKELTAQLQKTTNPAERTKLCQLQNLPRTKAIAERYVLDMRLLGAADVQNKALNPKEREILDAYLYSAKQKQVPISNIQKLTDTLFVYNAPISADSPICEACFGKQEVPFAVWHIGFQKREVVRRMNSTKKK